MTANSHMWLALQAADAIRPREAPAVALGEGN